MTKFKRLAYLGYYVKELDWEKFNHFTKYSSQQTGRSKLNLWMDALSSSVNYNISLMEYFQFRFYQIAKEDRLRWAGTGFMYEYQRVMNPPAHRNVLADKRAFLKAYQSFVHHSFLRKDDLINEKLTQEFIGKNSRLVLKSSDGQCGRGIEVISTGGLTPEGLRQGLDRTGNDMVEAFVEQHPDLQRLSPSGLNTVRIITQINKKGGVDFLGARLRITVNSTVDNLAAGNIAAPIDLVTGQVIGGGVYSDITKNTETHHPVTGVPIIGFQIPHWERAKLVVTEAALAFPENKSIGWDVAFTSEGVDLIEGNHDWCKLLWQLPVEQGLKRVLEDYLNEQK